MSTHIYCLILDNKILAKSKRKDIFLTDIDWLDDTKNQLTWGTTTAYRGQETKIHYCILDKETSPELPVKWLRPLEGDAVYTWYPILETTHFTKNDMNILSYICEKEIPAPDSNALWLELAETIYHDKGTIWSPNHLHQLKNSRANNTQFNRLPLSKILGVTGIAALLALLYRLGIYAQDTGINLFLFTLAMLSGLTYVTEKKPTRTLSKILLALTLVQSLQIVVFSNHSTHLLSVLSLPGLITLYGLSLQSNSFKKLSAPFTLKTLHRLWISPFKSFVFTLPILQKIKKNSKQSSLKGVKKDVLVGVGFAIPILLIAFALLSASDFVFNHMLTTFLEQLTHPFENLFGFGTYITLLFGLYFFGYLFSFLVSPEHNEMSKQQKQTWSPVTAMTLLLLVNTLYVFYACIQIPHLYFKWGTLPESFTYAEYARSGFFELVFLALLNMALSCLFIRFVNTEKSSTQKWVKSLNTLMSLLTMNFLVSSFYKLCLYEQAYGYTHLRLWVQCFTLALALCLIWLMRSIWQPAFSGFHACALTLITAFTLTTYGVNDSVIAEWNIAHYMKTHQIDVNYMASLSSEAATGILAFKTTDKTLLNMQVEYAKNLSDELANKTFWEWNYLSHRSIKTLESYKQLTK